MRLFRFFKHNLFYLVMIGGFLFFLLTVPYFNALTMTCLKHIPGESYAYGDCTMAGALDHFVLTALVGLVISLLIIYLKIRKQGLKSFVVLAIFLGALTIGAYYLYMPYAEKSVAASPVFLESLWDK